MMARFCGYVDKVFDLSEKLGWLTDSRPKPRLSTQRIWLSALFMSCTGLPSLNALQNQMGMPRRWEKLIGPRLPSADRIGDVAALMDPQPGRRILRDLLYQLKRNKVLLSPWPLNIMAVDGHEFFSLTQAALSGVF